jgi:chemotaxis protein methyltransferase CheR
MLKENFQEDREFGFTEKDFTRIRALIYKHAGISLSDAKADMVYSRIGRRVRGEGFDSFTAYLDDLESTNNATELEEFTNALTTNLTSFFREEHHFPVLAEYLKTLTGPIRIWCSAASTGEEPYTLAMTACEAFGTLTPPVEIIATDIDTKVLATAANGIYKDDRIKGLSEQRKKDFLLRGTGANAGTIRVKKELRDLVTFKQLNLLESQWPLKEKFDVLFCRNVMIYFDKPTQTTILKRFVPLMKPDALLFAGHSENFLYVSDDLKLLGKTVYELKK